MKTALLAAALTLAAAATPASAHTVDLKLGVLNQWCSTNTEKDQAGCVAYIMGVWHGVEMADALTRPDWRTNLKVKNPPRTLVCVPANPSIDVIVDPVTRTGLHLFIEGVIGGAVWSDKLARLPPDHRTKTALKIANKNVCIPEGVSVEDVQTDVKMFLITNLEKRREDGDGPAGAYVLLALMQLYPCKGAW
jgi:hypothetical protein